MSLRSSGGKLRSLTPVSSQRGSMFGAAARGDEDAVKRMVKAGASPNDRDDDGNTPLHYAVQSYQKRMVVMLVDECTAKPDKQSRVFTVLS